MDAKSPSMDEKRIKEYSSILNRISDPHEREKVRNSLLEAEIRLQVESKKITKQSLKNDKIQLQQENAELKMELRDKDKQIDTLREQLLTAVALPLVRCQVERLELLWFSPFCEKNLREFEAEEKKAIQVAMEKLYPKASNFESSHEFKMNYHFKKWLFILKCSKHSSLLDLKEALMKLKKPNQNEADVEREFCSNIAVLYSYSSSFIHSFVGGDYKSDEILQVIKKLGFSDPSFLTTVQVLMSYSKCEV